MTPKDKENNPLYREGFEAGVASVLSTRCLKHLLVPQLNEMNKESKQECPICFFEENRRKRLPDERQGITHHFKIGPDQDGYITVGLYPDGTPGEVFLTMSKQGTTIRGLLDCWAIMVSMALQYGIPLKDICKKFAYTRFEPMGNTRTDLHFATSVVDYVSRWLASRYIPKEEAVACGLLSPPETTEK